MNATVDFIEHGKENAWLIPVAAVMKENDGDYVLVSKDNEKEPVKTAVKLGMSDDTNAEVISGVSENDKIVVKTKKYVLPSSASGTNPFFPARRR